MSREEPEVDWTALFVEGLAAVSDADLPAVEWLFLSQVADSVRRYDSLSPSGSEVPAEVVAHLQLALLQARETICDRVPAVSPEVEAYRRDFVEGAHRFADLGAEGVHQLVLRTIPAIEGELRANDGDVDLQLGGVFSYTLLAVCCGPGDGDFNASAWEGIARALKGWTDLLTAR